MKFHTVLAVCTTCFVAVTAFAANNDKAKQFSAPKTEFGQPDLRGVWNFSSNTPLQRPREFGEKEFLTPEEVEAAKARRLARAQRFQRSSNTVATAPPAKGRGVGGYDGFWMEEKMGKFST